MRFSAFCFVLFLIPCSGAEAPTRQNIAQQYANLPLLFEANRGQADPSVRFVARRGDTYFLFTEDGVTLRQPGNSLQLRFPGARARAIHGERQSKALSHHYGGRDVSQWRTNVPNFAAIRYDDVWPGVSALFYGNGNEVEYDLLLAPNADPSQIAIEVDAGRHLTIDPDGDLRIDGPQGVFHQRRLHVFQQTSAGKHVLAARYRLLSKTSFGFDVDGYDSSLPLTIDPTLSYTSAFPVADRVTGVAIDISGNTYVTGSIVSQSADRDAFLTKFDPTGNNVLFTVTVGGTKDDTAAGVVIDTNNSIFLAGATNSPDFPSSSAYQGALNGSGQCATCNTDAFLVKLAANGSITFSTFYGGSGNDYATEIAIDKAGTVYIGGVAGVGANFPVTQGALKTNIGAVTGQEDGFLIKVPNSNATPIYSTLLGGTDSDKIWSISVDGAGNVYATGVTFSSDFPTTANAFQRVLTPPHNTFLVKLNPAGTALLYSTYYGGGSTIGTGVAVDEFGRAYVASNQVLSGVFMREAHAGVIPDLTSQASLVKFNSLATEVLAQFPITGGQFAMGVAVNAAGNPFVTGSTGGAAFIATPDALTGSANHPQAFLSVLNPFVNNSVYATILGTQAPPNGATGALTASGLRVALSGNSDAYLPGVFNYNPNLTGRNYVVKLSNFALAPCTDAILNVTPSSISFTGGSGAVNINTSCTWFAIPGSGSVTGAVNGSGTSNFTFTVSQNTGALPRPLSISAANKIIGIMQRGSGSAASFDDVPLSNGFSDYITLLRNNGVTSGCSSTTYCPDGTVNRGQMAVFIIRAMMGGDNFTYPAAPYFNDVPTGHGFFRWIQKLRELGITTGCGQSNYCPDNSVTRGEVAVFLVRARFGNAFSFSTAPYFTDVPNTDGLFPFIQKMRETGITAGCTATTYCPEQQNNRGQMAVFLIRGFFTPW